MERNPRHVVRVGVCRATLKQGYLHRQPAVPGFADGIRIVKIEWESNRLVPPACLADRIFRALVGPRPCKLIHGVIAAPLRASGRDGLLADKLRGVIRVGALHRIASNAHGKRCRSAAGQRLLDGYDDRRRVVGAGIIRAERRGLHRSAVARTVLYLPK